MLPTTVVARLNKRNETSFNQKTKPVKFYMRALQLKSYLHEKRNEYSSDLCIKVLLKRTAAIFALATPRLTHVKL